MSKVEEIRRGWVTDYPNPNFTGDKVQCLASIEQAHNDIKILFEAYDSLVEALEEAENTLEDISCHGCVGGYDCNKDSPCEPCMAQYTLARIAEIKGGK